MDPTSLRRVIVPELAGIELIDVVQLDASYAHYLHRVLRLDTGQQIELCDGRDRRWIATITTISSDILELAIEESLPPAASLFPVYLAQALPKSDKMEQILQRCTELGVSGFFPFFSSRCIVKLDAKKAAKRLTRWQRIVQEACRQCQRSAMPIIEPPCAISSLVERFPPMLSRVVCWEGEVGLGLDDWIRANPQPEGVIVVIGPEGGFDASEIELLAQNDVASVSLGPLILRTETAGPAVASILQFQYGALGSLG